VTVRIVTAGCGTGTCWKVDDVFSAEVKIVLQYILFSEGALFWVAVRTWGGGGGGGGE
jgi:hypothetical protein